MKRILLGTTALIGSVALFAGAASAEGPKVTLGGFVNFQAGVMNDDLDTNMRNHAFRNDTEISVKVDGKTDQGLGYGGEVWLESDIEAESGSGSSATTDADHQGLNASKTFVYLDGMWGRLEGGSNIGADQTMKVDAASIARATGGIDGSWTYFANSAALFIATPDLPINYGLTGGRAQIGGVGYNTFLGDESQENLTKLTYYTPRFAGFQAGLSYAPSDQERGQFVTGLTRIDNTAAVATGGAGTVFTISEADSVWQGGLNYQNTFSNVGVAASLTGEAGNAEDPTSNDLRAWAAGAKASYMGFALAGSYGNWGDSLRAKAAANDSSNHYWTVGGAYEWGPFGASVTYLNSKLDVGATSNDFHNTSVGVDYKLAPGFTPYVEASWYSQDVGGTATGDNDGTVFIAGTLLSF